MYPNNYTVVLGMTKPTPSETLSPGDWEQVLSLNWETGKWRTTGKIRAALTRISKRGTGRISNHEMYLCACVPQITDRFVRAGLPYRIKFVRRPGHGQGFDSYVVKVKRRAHWNSSEDAIGAVTSATEQGQLWQIAIRSHRRGFTEAWKQAIRKLAKKL